MKTYTVTPALGGLWADCFASMKDLPKPLTIRLALCRLCGFLFYRDTFTYGEMKQLYQAEARYKKPRHHRAKPGRKWELGGLEKFFKNNVDAQKIDSVLDLGAGDFDATDLLIRLIPGAAFEALDPSYRKAKHNSVKVYRTMVEEFTPQKSYRLVTAIHILEHADNLHQFMQKSAGLVAKNGYFYVEIPYQVGPGILLNRSVNTQHVNYYTPETILNLVSRNGFAVNAIEFDTSAYRHNGMPGMIRLLAQKQSRAKPTQSNPANTLFHLYNPGLIIKMLAGR